MEQYFPLAHARASERASERHADATQRRELVAKNGRRRERGGKAKEQTLYSLLRHLSPYVLAFSCLELFPPHFLSFSFSTVPIHSPPREWTTEPTSFPIDGHLLTPLDRAIYISRPVSIRIVSINGVKKSSIRTFLSSSSFPLLLLPLPFRSNSASTRPIRGKRIAQLREKLAEKVSLARYVQKPGREISFHAPR